MTSLLRLLGVDLPSSVDPGAGFTLVHGGTGVVIHEMTEIGPNVRIYQGVTIGRGDVWNVKPSPDFEGFEIGPSCILGAGSKVISSSGRLTMGSGTVLGANSVLTRSTPPRTIWAGVPAKMIGSVSEPPA